MQLQMFSYKEEDQLSKVRTVEIEGEIWFVANDVAKLLGYKRLNDAIS
jgi:prophage antirepressor-like protein